MEREKMSQAKQKEVPAMKMLKGFTILLSLMFVLGVMKAAQAELQTIYGPIYVTKAKAEGKYKEDGAETTATAAVKAEKETRFPFIAPVPGAGIIVIKNGGDSGKKHRVSSAEVKLNGVEIAHESDFNKNVETLQYDVQLLQGMNELEVELKSCKECEIEITVLGEKLPPRLPAR